MFLPIVKQVSVRYFLRFVEHAEKDFAQEIRDALRTRATTPFAVEKTHGLPEDAIRSVLRGAKKKGTTLNSAKAICDALGLEFYIGKPRTETAPVMLDGTEFDTIRRFDVSAAAGDGMINPEGDPVDHLAFSRRWLASQGISPGDSYLITVRGDSMEPSIYHGDLVMIDQRKIHIRSGKIYAFRDGEALRIKRIEVIPDTALILRSDNPKHAPDHRVGNAMNEVSQNILGQVVWSGHSWA